MTKAEREILFAHHAKRRSADYRCTKCKRVWTSHYIPIRCACGSTEVEVEKLPQMAIAEATEEKPPQ